MRSGREHWAWIFADEVRQEILDADGRGWGPAGKIGQMVVFKVRQGTLGADGRGWGPIENTVDRGSKLDEEDDEDDEEDEEERIRRKGGGGGEEGRGTRKQLT